MSADYILFGAENSTQENAVNILLSQLNEKGLKLVKTTLENADFTAAVPAFEKGKKYPEIWYKNGKDKIYIFNFTDDMKNYTVDAYKGCTYREIFDDKDYKAQQGKIEFSLPPHGCLCLYKTK